MTNIKICGITNMREIDYLNRSKVDYAGFVFYEKSKRYITPGSAQELAKALLPEIKKVAVTVDPDRELVKEIEDRGFDILQVHGNPAFGVIKDSAIPVWYAINTKDIEKLDEEICRIDGLLQGESQKIEAFVADAPVFGSGQTFDWTGSRRPDTKSRMFILAGGLNAGNVVKGIKIFNPDAVDVSSSVEGEHGKDEKKIKEFVAAVRDIKECVRTGGDNE